MKKYFANYKEDMQFVINFMNRYSLILHFIWCACMCFLIECFSRRSFMKAAGFLIQTPLTFMYNTLIIFITLLIVYFFKRRTLMRFVLSTVWLFLGIINGCVLSKRVTPFGYTDMKLVGDLLAMKSNYFTPLLGAIAIAALVLFVVSVILLYRKGPQFKGHMHRKVMALVCVLCFISMPFISKAAVRQDVITDYFDNIAQGYEKYGFVYGFSSSVIDTGMSKPDGYDQHAINQLLNRTAKTLEEQGKKPFSGDSYIIATENTIEVTMDEANQTSTPLTNNSSEDELLSVSGNSIQIIKADPTDPDSPNIILILLESFVDPTELTFMDLSEDPVPNFHYLENNFSTGYLSVPVVGAGTANSEFEVLTGMNMMFFGPGEYPYKTILKKTDCESSANVLRNCGYGTKVVHNNSATFYSRNNAFAQMGFENFISREFMDIHEYNPLETWPVDDILRQNVQDALDSTPEQSDFVYTITVQAHGAYPDEKIFDEPEICVSTNSYENATQYQWEYYVNEVHEVDKFIGNLISDLEKRDEKTFVVMFGDHLPTMGLANENTKSGDIYKTKYITWNNFGLAKHDEELTSYQLMANVLDEIGIHEGTILTYHQAKGANLSSEMDEDYMNELEILQYDLLYGNRYAYSDALNYKGIEIEMGVKDTSIKKVTVDEERGIVIINGENFTPWSKVFYNGKKCGTKEIDSNNIYIKINDRDIKSGDSFVVSQCSGDNIFRSSEEFIYQGTQ